MDAGCRPALDRRFDTPSLLLCLLLLFLCPAGLDSLDAVEVGMALEDEFGIEIPDAEADKIQSVEDAIKYIAANGKAQ